MPPAGLRTMRDLHGCAGGCGRQAWIKRRHGGWRFDHLGCGECEGWRRVVQRVKAEAGPAVFQSVSVGGAVQTMITSAGYWVEFTSQAGKGFHGIRCHKLSEEEIAAFARAHAIEARIIEAKLEYPR